MLITFLRMPATGIFKKPWRLAASKRIRSFWVSRCPTPRLPILPRVDSPRLSRSMSFLSGLGIGRNLKQKAESANGLRKCSRGHEGRRARGPGRDTHFGWRVAAPGGRWRDDGRSKGNRVGGVWVGRRLPSPRPPEKECTINRAPTWVRPAANDDLRIAGIERVGMVKVC